MTSTQPTPTPVDVVSPHADTLTGRLERVDSIVRLAVRADGRATRLVENYQAGAVKTRFPRRAADSPLETVLINTAGGLTGGDRLAVAVTAGADAKLLVTTQAAERIYRRSAGAAVIGTNIGVAAGASLDWLPQETIVFDRSALRRRLTAEVSASGRLLAVEAIVLGRTAMGEKAKNVVISDSWRISRDGVLVFADGVALDGDADAVMAGRATGAGAVAFATLVLVAADAESRIDSAREKLATCAGEGGASAWNGMLVARLIAPTGQALRGDLISLIECLRGAPVPRVWRC